MKTFAPLLAPIAASLMLISTTLSAQTCLSDGLETTPDEDFTTITSSTVLHEPKTWCGSGVQKGKHGMGLPVMAKP
jgi:hypothetical protein